MNNILIGLVGCKQVGKDTVATFLTSHVGFHQRSFAKPIKDACRLIFQIESKYFEDGDLKEVVNDVHGMSPRQMMQTLGTDMFRNMIHPNFWVNHFMRWYNEANLPKVVVSDVRFQNELDAIKSLGGIIIKIVRETGYSDDHISEKGVSQLKGVDYVIENNGDIRHLFERVSEILQLTD